jgi:acetyl esterase
LEVAEHGSLTIGATSNAASPRSRSGRDDVEYAIDAELQPLLELLPATDLSDLAETRSLAMMFVEMINADLDTSGVVITEVEVPGPDGDPPVFVRVVAPAAPAHATGCAGLLHIHGGGFVSGSVDMELASLVEMSRELGITVASVEYRLAPEHPFPAGVEDCYCARLWFAEQAESFGIDPNRIGVGGGSAGGGLAAAVALMARDRNGPSLCFQYLGIPQLDHRLETVSMRTFTDTPLWNRPAAELSWQYYLGTTTNEVSPYASPAVATDLSGLPPAYVSTMEFDPLRDEGIEYALRLLQAGVNVELHSFPGTFHGSQAVSTAAVSQRASRELMVALSRGLGVVTEED